MAFDPTKTGISEAAADALLAYLQARVSDLNTFLQRDTMARVSAITTAQFLLGDGQFLPLVGGKTPEIWFTVQAGDDAGLELIADYSQIGGGDGRSFMYRYMAEISAYIYPDTVFSTDPATQVSVRHRLLSRLQDWLRIGCINRDDTVAISLTSVEYNPSSGSDSLVGCMLSEIMRGERLKGNLYVPCVSAQFTAWIS